MADSFFGFDTSVSNINDDEGGGGPSEDEYDALNDETFGQDSDLFDWEAEHELVASQLESSRRSNAANAAIENNHCRQLEASISQLVLDETEAPQSRTLGSAVWRHDLPFGAPTPVPTLKNVCTVEELERQLRQKQPQQPPQQQQGFQNYYHPRFPPVILQRPPGLQAPVPLPFAPQQNMQMNQMNQPMSQMNQPMSQMNQSMNQMNQSMNNVMTQNSQSSMNQMGQNVNQFMQNANQMAFQNNQMQMSVNQMQTNQLMGQRNHNVHQMGQNLNQMSQNANQMGQNMNQMGTIMSNVNQMAPNVNQMAQKSQNVNQMGQNVNQMGQNMNQMGQNMNQLGQNVNQMMPNGNQFPLMNQFPPLMGQPRMIGPPGINMQRQNFNPSMGQFNPNFRGPTIQPKPDQPINTQNMLMNHQMLPQHKTQPMPITTNSNQMNHVNQTNHINHNQTILNHNQSPQKQNNIQKTSNRIDPKSQKSRVYNNSNMSNSLNNKSLTSQSMVQIIQNTHPMLQFNNSFHNANHHPMLNRNNNAFSNQFVNNQMFHQRHNGSYNDNHRHSMNGDDASSSSEGDDYAGLMSQREKQWLINIQMLQLNSGTPYIHDFYYTVFLERKANKEKEGVKEAHKANQQNHPFYSGTVNKPEPGHGRERHNSNRHNSTSEDSAAPRAYVPAQFENSLGKLQCGSVTAPRKIIDLEVVAPEPGDGRASRAPSVASTTNPSEFPRELKRTKQLLLDIEALYLILLRLEELNDPLAISNALILKEREEKQKLLEAQQKEAENEPEDESNVFLRNIESVHRRPKQESPKGETVDKRQVVNLAVNQKPVPVKNLLDEDKDELINRMFAGLLHSDRVQQMMAVRKGRCLIARFVRRSGAAHPLGRLLWARVLRALPAAARRDDGSLPQLAAPYRKYIQSSSGWSGVLESCSILGEALDPARTPHALTSSLTLSCVCALVEKAATLVTTPDATSSERQWFKFLKTLARALKNTTLTVARPVQPLPEQRVTQHVKLLESRSTVEILQRGKAAEFADLSKSDVSEQLIRHLC